jgi:hypothetical protein
MGKITNIETAKRQRKKKKKPIPKDAAEKRCDVYRKTCSNPHCRATFKDETVKRCPLCGRARKRCKHDAGYLTTHPGVGPCYLHGGIRKPKLGKAKGKGAPEYTEDARAEALIRLIMNRGNVAKTARETGIDARTIRHWKNEDPAYFKRLAALTKRDVADVCLRVAKKGFERILTLIPEEEKIPDVVKAVTAAIDKAQILTGGATARTEHGKSKATEDLSDEELEEEIRATEAEIRATDGEAS